MLSFEELNKHNERDDFLSLLKEKLSEKRYNKIIQKSLNIKYSNYIKSKIKKSKFVKGALDFLKQNQNHQIQMDRIGQLIKLQLKNHQNLNQIFVLSD